ncbi:MAG: MBL fold metallo-hydrolase [Magnetococcales bacterium]|nr:MBL fold metallo-hydrolase [Magnetococcales bacterium]
MKKIIYLLTLLSSFLWFPTSQADWVPLGDKVHAYVGSKDASPAHSFAANAGIVIGRDGVLVVDTLISAREGERFVADIRKVTDKPILFVVNTHTHLDHAFGNIVFARMGATLISHEAEQATLATKGSEMLKNTGVYGLKPEDMAGTEIVVPRLSFNGQMSVDLGGVTVRLIHLGPSHTSGSSVVYIPESKILFAGDILFTDFHPYLADADFDGWSKTLDQLMAMEVERIIPGHGPLSTKKDLQAMKEYLALFDTKARELAATTQDPAVIAQRLLALLPKRSLAEWMVATNVKGRYLGKK